jgi:rfaE bifunctional protein nucleotidyltransferase chain/domain
MDMLLPGRYEVTRDGKPLKIVLCHGVFDLCHLGHIRHLQEAKKFGDYLIVSVTADKHVHKGIGRPHFTQDQRAEALRALACVDEVIINEDVGPWDLIRNLRPAFYVKGVDYVGVTSEALEKDRAAIAEVGGLLKFTGTRKWSSSALLKMENFSSEVCQYLETLKKLDARDKIFDAFSKADEKTILFVGETISDVYKYVQGLAKPSKEMMLATVEIGHERFLGGVLAACRHAEWKKQFAVTAGNITKLRYVDSDFNRKLFDVYLSRDVDLPLEERHEFRDKLMDAVGTADVVIVNDFGHGLMGSIERDTVKEAGFLALNCQTNAGNYGFNLVTKYPQADFVCIDDPEARLAAGDQSGSMEHVISILSSRIRCKKYLITHGKFGSKNFTTSSAPGRYSCASSSHPALVTGGVDTMGAGDAVMAVTAPLVAAGLELSLAAFVGNIVGAVKVSIVGHRRHVGRQEILQTVEALLA